jgi:hypothetical protein
MRRKWLLHTVLYVGCLILLLWQSWRIRDLQDMIASEQLYASKRQAQVDACSQFLCEEHSDQRGWQLQLMETQGKLMRCEKAVIAKRR